jgi:hypothetical protein
MGIVSRKHFNILFCVIISRERRKNSWKIGEVYLAALISWSMFVIVWAFYASLCTALCNPDKSIFSFHNPVNL